MPNYTTPPTAVAGQGLPAADWNTKVRDSIENLAKPPRARVYRNASQAVGHAAVSNVVWQAEHHDSDELWVPGSPTRLTVPAGAGGIWHVGFTGQFSINATGGRHAGIYKNGALFATANAPGSAAWYVGIGCDLEIYAAPGEYFEVGVYQTSGAALNLDVAYPIAMWAHQVAR